VLMCEVEAAIGARSHVVPEVKAAPGAAPCLGYCSYPSRPRCRAGTTPMSTRTVWPGSQEAGLVRLTTQETREQMLHARANVHAASELVALRQVGICAAGLAFQLIVPRPPA
jgi:hypothetical protein